MYLYPNIGLRQSQFQGSTILPYYLSLCRCLVHEFNFVNSQFLEKGKRQAKIFRKICGCQQGRCAQSAILVQRHTARFETVPQRKAESRKEFGGGRGTEREKRSREIREGR